MNRERLLELADHIEKMPMWRGPLRDLWNSHTETHYFSIDHYAEKSQSCGTVCCIAGETVRLWGPQFPLERASSLDPGYCETAGRLLGLDREQEQHLFLPPLRRQFSFTPKVSASCIRHLAETGRVEWYRFL